MESRTVTEPFLDLHCGLAESPFWEKDDDILRFVDIVNATVYRVNLSKGPSTLQKQTYDSAICITADTAADKDDFIFGGKYGVGVCKKNSTKTRSLCSFWSEIEEQDGKPAKMRANDGGVDARGRFWVSALCDPEVTTLSATATLFRMDVDGSLHRVVEGLTIPNGMSWSPDNQTLYLTDTNDRTIWAYDFDLETAQISNKRTFFKTEEGTGPDGHAQDEQGNLWVAVWGGWKVVKVTPDGEVTSEIKLPTRCITAVAFANENVYMTSEKDPEPERYPESVKNEGAVFTCHVGVRGKPSHPARVQIV